MISPRFARSRAKAARSWLRPSGVALGAIMVALTPSACSTHDCDPSTSTFRGDAGVLTSLSGGQLVWQSSALNGKWLDYPGNRTIHVEFPAGFINAQSPVVWVSTGEDQDDAGSTATPASGQLAEIPNITSRGFDLQNASCANYFVYFELHGFSSNTAMDAGGDAPHD